MSHCFCPRIFCVMSVCVSAALRHGQGPPFVSPEELFHHSTKPIIVCIGKARPEVAKCSWGRHFVRVLHHIALVTLTAVSARPLHIPLAYSGAAGCILSTCRNRTCVRANARHTSRKPNAKACQERSSHLLA
ncbi:hypothetical protein BC835DRAFT_916529 [Cytidiella melzeri]|nr:hypothetical protein BC835DRAFT_916529 [Cytidiella melzeri]